MSRACGRSAAARPGSWAVGQPTLRGGPVRLHPVKATLVFYMSSRQYSVIIQMQIAKASTAFSNRLYKLLSCVA